MMVSPTPNAGPFLVIFHCVERNWQASPATTLLVFCSAEPASDAEARTQRNEKWQKKKVYVGWFGIDPAK